VTTDSTSLACLGALPAFNDKLHVGRPNIGDRERLMGLINGILDRRWLSNNGECVREFERRMCAHLGVRHCIPVCNATVGLEVAIRALDLRGEVIVPSFTFIATAHALQWQEITPVFCDIDPATHNLDPAKVVQLITPRTTGIIGVHVWGRPCSVDELQEIAKARGLRLMYDAAHAFGCSAGEKMIGNFGEAEVFSFHATKFLNSFEGGAIATNNDELAARIRLMINFGFSGYDNVIYVGTNGKMSEVSAAMGIVSLESVDRFIEVNRSHFAAYQREFATTPGLAPIRISPQERHNYQYVIVEVDAQAFGLTRDELLQVLHAENVLVRRYFFPGSHRQMPYRAYYPNAGLLLPRTEELCDRVLSFPTGTGVTNEDIARIGVILRAARANASAIRQHLQLRTSA
jgi:dTDP-4-amino-4,6-dideoxygalactose transaminase